VEYPLIRDNAILIGVISVARSTTDLASPTQARFTLVSKFGEQFGGTGGISTTTLQQAYDNSSTPEITINSTLDGLSIKNGTGNADNVTRLLEGLDAAGNATSFIRADGDISGTTLQTNGFTANTGGITASTVNIRTIGSGTSITNLGIDSSGNIVSGSTTGSSGTFTGGTVSGPTNFTNGLTADTISATTYYNLPVTADTYVTGFSLTNDVITLSQNREDEYSAFTISLSAYTGTTDIFTRNETYSSTTSTISTNQSIFNPSNLTILSDSTFIVEQYAEYYVLGDLTNYGVLIVNGTLKIGGALYDYGTISGTGVIE
jgi:hypothetical protein